MKDPGALTRHPIGSLRELLAISLPLMISSLASLFMIFTDRIFLAHYSIDALNSSVNAGTLAWAFMGGIATLTSMSEVFVAQYNGSGRYSRLGQPVWQMIWVSLLSSLIFIPLAIWGAPAIFSGNPNAGQEITYFRWLIFFTPSYALMTALGGFFIGQGKTRILILLAVVGNLINIVLDWLLIFGVPGWIPEMGIQGAAIATCLGYVFESVALAYLFFKRENREQFGTSKWQIHFQEMKKCWKIGLPQGIFYFLEVLGWALFYWMMTSMGEKHITISSICQSISILLSFFSDGLSRAAAAVAGNLIGAKQHAFVKKVLRSGFFLLASFAACTSIFLVIDPVSMVKLLFFEHFDGGIHLADTRLLDPAFEQSLRICMIFTFIYMFFDWLRWLFSGLLAAAGDTLFLLIAGSFSVWVFLLAPMYWIIVRNNLAVEYAWGYTMAYSALFGIVYWMRYKKGAWQNIDLIGPADSSTDTPRLQPAPTLADQSE